MDLRPLDATPSDAERDAVDALLGPARDDDSAPVSLGASLRQRHLLLPALHAAQDRVGWVSPGALAYIARRLHVPPAEAYGVASFYALFALTPRPARVAHVCDDVACMARGAEGLCDGLTARLGPAGSQTDGAGWHRSPCLGLCEQGPAVLVQHAGPAPDMFALGDATVDGTLDALVGRTRPEPSPTVLQQPRDGLRLLARVGTVNPSSLDAYRAAGGFRALRNALALGPAGIVRELTDSRLAGRGGAAFPTARKWQAVASQPARPHYVVCNADESEPGTFKDRVLMECDPFALVEAVTIAAYATGAEEAFLYVRDEYPLARARLAEAIAQCRARGFLGHDILGRGVSVDITLCRGAGAYICGEETALLNSLEGRRGEPRAKPPFPVEQGLFGKPTAINNVETLVAVLDVLSDGGAAFAQRGTAQSTGTRLFCLSGHVAKPGVYEVPFGTRLRDLLDLAGGLRDGAAFGAALLGGAAGVWVGPESLDVALSLEDARAAGLTLGSGVVMVLDDRTELLPYLRRIAGFFRDESCGQCVPCRVGTVRVEELLSRVARRTPLDDWDTERARLAELGQCMRDASICGLGQTATSAVESALARFPLVPGARV